MARSRVRSLAVVLASISFVGVGCGVTAGEGASRVSAGIAPSSATAAALTRAADRTGEVTTMRMHIEVTTSGTGVGSIAMSADGEIDSAKGLAHLSTTYDGSSSVFGNMAIETVTDGKAVYLKSALFSSLTGGKPWVKISASDADVLSTFDQGLQSGPKSILRFFDADGKNQVTTLGVEYVRGVETRHVRTEIDLKDALAAATGGRKQELRDQLEQMGAALDSLKPIPMDAWIDGDGYVRKFTMTMDLGGLTRAGGTDDEPGSDSGKSIAVTQTYELFDFDEPVDIVIPKADEVGEVDPSLLKGD